MINYEFYEQEIEKGNIKNGYAFCGLDEELIKDGVNLIVKRTVEKELEELNLIKIDGMNTTFDDIFNACETMPFMSEKKVVIIYRANFLQEKSDSSGTKIYNEIKGGRIEKTIEEISKEVSSMSEESKIAIRNIRRDVMDKIKNMKKSSEITEDELKSGEKKIQDLTDKFCKQIEDICNSKISQVMSL